MAITRNLASLQNKMVKLASFQLSRKAQHRHREMDPNSIGFLAPMDRTHDTKVRERILNADTSNSSTSTPAFAFLDLDFRRVDRQSPAHPDRCEDEPSDRAEQGDGFDHRKVDRTREIQRTGNDDQAKRDQRHHLGEVLHGDSEGML